MKRKNIRNIKYTTFFISIVILTTQVLSVNFYFLGDQDRRSSELSTEDISPLSLANTWVPNGIAICSENYNQWYSQICSDGAGGAIITWDDERSGLKGDIYAQKVNSTGDVQWVDDGVAICTENNNQGSPEICSEEDGGAIITWNDKRNGLNYDIYAQKINSNGNLIWNANGTEICTENETQAVPQICSDGNGGAIITWTDYRNEKNYDIYAQKINSTGDVVWNANGTEICTIGGDQIFSKICSDGAGGAIITWEDSRGIYTQRINSTGDVKWAIDGVAICTADNDQKTPQINSLGTGSAIITWSDYRSGTNSDIYAQWINSTGDVQWIANGTAICTADNDQETPQINSLGTGSAIITWKDSRGTDADIYAQKINSSGYVQWIIDGVVVCAADEDQKAPQICNDGNGGAIITWEDSRDIGDMYADIYAQRVNSTGEIQGMANGVAVSKATFAQRQPQICSDDQGGAIITWFDKRNGIDYDVYAQRLKIEPPLNGDDGEDGDKAFPIELIIIISSIIGGIVIVSIVTVFILKKRRKIEQ